MIKPALRSLAQEWQLGGGVVLTLGVTAEHLTGVQLHEYDRIREALGLMLFAMGHGPSHPPPPTKR